jgi:hypothetical protein
MAISRLSFGVLLATLGVAIIRCFLQKANLAPRRLSSGGALIFILNGRARQSSRMAVATDLHARKNPRAQWLMFSPRGGEGR